MRNRLERGRLHKAERGELVLNVPCGYVKLPTGEVALTRMSRPARPCSWSSTSSTNWAPSGASSTTWCGTTSAWASALHKGRGAASWNGDGLAGDAGPDAPSPDLRGGLFLRPPPRRPPADGLGRRQGGMRSVPMSEWKVLQRDRVPAYITWERYLANLQRLLAEPLASRLPGRPATGRALLTGLLVCGTCGRRMPASYRSKTTVLRVYAAGGEGATVTG